MHQRYLDFRGARRSVAYGPTRISILKSVQARVYGATGKGVYRYQYQYLLGAYGATRADESLLSPIFRPFAFLSWYKTLLSSYAALLY